MADARKHTPVSPQIPQHRKHHSCKTSYVHGLPPLLNGISCTDGSAIVFRSQVVQQCQLRSGLVPFMQSVRPTAAQAPVAEQRLLGPESLLAEAKKVEDDFLRGMCLIVTWVAASLTISAITPPSTKWGVFQQCPEHKHTRSCNSLTCIFCERGCQCSLPASPNRIEGESLLNQAGVRKCTLLSATTHSCMQMR